MKYIEENITSDISSDIHSRFLNKELEKVLWNRLRDVIASGVYIDRFDVKEAIKDEIYKIE